MLTPFEEWPKIPDGLVEKMEERVDHLAKMQRLHAENMEQQASAVNREHGMLSALRLIQQAHNAQQPKDPIVDGKPEQRGAKRWPPAGASPGRVTHRQPERPASGPSPSGRSPRPSGPADQR